MLDKLELWHIAKIILQPYTNTERPLKYRHVFQTQQEHTTYSGCKLNLNINWIYGAVDRMLSNPYIQQCLRYVDYTDYIDEQGRCHTNPPLSNWLVSPQNIAYMLSAGCATTPVLYSIYPLKVTPGKYVYVLDFRLFGTYHAEGGLMYRYLRSPHAILCAIIDDPNWIIHSMHMAICNNDRRIINLYVEQQKHQWVNFPHFARSYPTVHLVPDGDQTLSFQMCEYTTPRTKYFHKLEIYWPNIPTDTTEFNLEEYYRQVMTAGQVLLTGWLIPLKRRLKYHLERSLHLAPKPMQLYYDKITADGIDLVDSERFNKFLRKYQAYVPVTTSKVSHEKAMLF